MTGGWERWLRILKEELCGLLILGKNIFECVCVFEEYSGVNGHVVRDGGRANTSAAKGCQRPVPAVQLHRGELLGVIDASGTREVSR